mmetsp:Transcript_41534/g.103244  ORF Transcript_41534/g.103244 Transcript_41534/m.103244 type:complete len:208 (+) Transcript_41534:62-685(+)
MPCSSFLAEDDPMVRSSRLFTPSRMSILTVAPTLGRCWQSSPYWQSSPCCHNQILFRMSLRSRSWIMLSIRSSNGSRTCTHERRSAIASSWLEASTASMSCHSGNAREASMKVVRVTHPLKGASASSYAVITSDCAGDSLVGVAGRMSLRSMCRRKRQIQNIRTRRAQRSPIAALGSINTPPGWCMSLQHSASSRLRIERCLSGLSS